MPAFTIACRGVRGSVPVSGPQFYEHGGATTCFEIEHRSDHRVLVDMGTGALAIPALLPDDQPVRFSVFLTHLHWDHVLGMPFFGPLFQQSNEFDFYGHPVMGMSIDEAIDAVMRPPWFPVTFASSAATKRFHHLDGEVVTIDDITVRHTRLHHPGGVTAYRLERRGAAVVIATDVEHGDEASDMELLDFATGADLLIYDAQYLPQEQASIRAGWGHSTWRAAVELARRCDVGRLLLTSHDPGRTDDEVDRIVEQARTVFPATDAAAEGMTITVP